ncbi:MAG: hypothetical protein ABW061_19540, partial [Polyangiaceae bacterium]
MMGVRSLFVLLSVVSLFSFVGCSKDPTKVEPETRGQRGENCQARNDCQTGLACLNGICGINEFSVGVAVKQCDRVECATTDDCCGDKPTEVPTKCNARATTCTSTFPGCSATQVCTSDAACGDEGGSCRPAATVGTCSTGTLAGLSCETATDCQDLCETDTCSYSLIACTEDTDCTYYSTVTPTCTKPSRTCNCTNPDYNPSAAICSDPDCTDLCTLRCDDERCVPDLSCKNDGDCSTGAPFCLDEQCVQCKGDDDCGDGKSCDTGICHARCKHNEECSAFYECNVDSGECEYAGCKSDRECILAATGSQTSGAASTPSGEDPRLLKCLPSEADPTFKTCKIPCENDGSCGAQSVCDGGYCKFIGCETNEDCRAYLGLVGQVPTPARP